MPRLKNIDYNSNTNFEELKVNNNNVALESQIPDISTKANINHNHDSLYSSINHNHEISDVYKEFEETIEEEENGEIINKVFKII